MIVLSHARSIAQNLRADLIGDHMKGFHTQPPARGSGAARQLAILTLLCWLSMLGFDFFVHAGVLATLYLQPSPFLLPAQQAFQRIPLGYTSFLLLAILLVWLLIRLRLRSGRSGAVFGVQVGGLMWGAVVLGLLSISTANGWLLLGWWVGQTLELGLAGCVAGSGLGAQRLRPLSAKVLTFVVVMVALTIAMQSLGVAPTNRAP